MKDGSQRTYQIKEKTSRSRDRARLPLLRDALRGSWSALPILPANPKYAYQTFTHQTIEISGSTA